MEQSLGLRLYVAYRITAGLIVGGLGLSVLWMGGTTGETVPFVGSAVVLVLSLFVALVVALEGVIVLIERSVEGSQ